MLFNKIFDRINHLIFSVQSQNKWFGMLGTSNYVNYSRRNPKRSAQYVDHTGTLASSIARAGTSLRKGRGANQQSIKYTMDFLSIPEYFTKKGRPHGHRYGKKPGDMEYFSANQLKKKCKKKFFQGIHDRFIRDETFRHRMIENGRNEDVCRQWDALADEDHTHHLTPREYYHYKSNWWLTSNKTDSNTVAVEHRPDLKQALSTLQQLKEKEEEAQRNQRWAQSSSSSSSWWSWQVSWWTPHSYESHHGDEPSTDWTRRLVIQVFGTNLQGMIFLNSFTLSQMDRLQLTAVYCNGRVCVNTTPQMTCFRGAKVCTKWLQDKVTIKSYSLTTCWNWEQVTSWNWDQDKNGTKSGKLRIGHDCVVLHDADSNDNTPWLRGTARCEHQWQHDHFHRLPQWLSMSAHCLVLSCLYIVTRTRTVAKEMSLSHHPHVHVLVSVSPRPCSPFLFHALPDALLPFPPALEVCRLQPAAHSAQRGYGLVWRVPPHHIYHVGCAINLHSIINSGLIPEDKFWTTGRQYSSCLWILWTKNTSILTRSTWEHRVMHNTCIKHGRNIKTQCVVSTSILLWGKDWSSIRHDRTPSFFMKHSQLIVSRKLFGWKLEKSFTRK